MKGARATHVVVDEIRDLPEPQGPDDFDRFLLGLVGEEPDWSFLNDAEMMAVIGRAARYTARKYEDTRTVEFEDARQEAMLLVATRPALRDPEATYGQKHFRLVQDLTDRYKAEARRRSGSKLVSWEDNERRLAAGGV